MGGMARQSPLYLSSFHGSLSLANGAVLEWEFMEAFSALAASIGESESREF